VNTHDLKDYYEILEVHKNASQDVIKRAYTILAKKNHPDLNQHNIEIATKKMSQLNEAYEVLSNKDKRDSYDPLHEFLHEQLMNSNYRNNYNTNQTSQSYQYNVDTDYGSNIIKPSNIIKRYRYDDNNKNITYITYAVIAAIVLYSVFSNLM